MLPRHVYAQNDRLATCREYTKFNELATPASNNRGMHIHDRFDLLYLVMAWDVWGLDLLCHQSNHGKGLAVSG